MAYCVDQNDQVVENQQCDNEARSGGGGAFFWYYGAGRGLNAAPA